MHLVLLIWLFLVYYLLGGDKGINDLTIRRKQVVAMGVALFLFAALRAYTVGIDVRFFYYLMYASGSSHSLNDIFRGLVSRDPGFFLLVSILQTISPNPQLMLAVVGAFVAFGFSYFAFHEKGNVLLFYMMFIGFRLFPFTLSGLRQALAMSLVFVAYIKLKENKNVAFLILTLLASSFHVSAVIFLFAFPAIRIKKTPVLILSVLGISVLNIISNGAITNGFVSAFFSDRFSGYIAASQENEFEGSLTVYIYLVIYLVSILFLKQLKREDQYYYKVFNILTIGIFFAILGQTVDNVFRISYYFIYALYPVFCKVLSLSVNNKNVESFTGAVISVLLAMQYIILGPGAGTDEYRFFWDVSF